MYITKKMLNKEFQKKYWILKLIAFMMSNYWGIKLINKFSRIRKGADIKGIDCEEIYIPGRSGNNKIRVRIFKPLNSTEKLPGMLYIHGGGYLTGIPEFFLDVMKRFIEAKPCVIVSPDYRLALEAPFPAAFDDCYDTLLWLKENSEKIGAIPNNFIVAGHSAGGGLTAAVSLKARDSEDVHIAFQMPIYPMLDDRQLTHAASNTNAPVWNSISNNYAWNQYLKDFKEKNMDIPFYAAAARANDYSKLPPAITLVGDLDLFLDETIVYVENLKNAGIPVEFKLFKGCFHAFDIIVPEAKISKDAWFFLLNSYSDYIDKYIKIND